LGDRIEYIKNTFDSDIFYPLSQGEKQHQRRELALKLGLHEDTRFILFAGRLHPQKDPILLIQAYAKVNQSHTHLLIAGDGELTSQVNTEIARLGLSAQVTMLGAIPIQYLANLHRISSVFVLSSAYEGLPLVVLETLASGTPVVTTKSGETPKLLAPDSGIVCEERTPICIAKAIDHVLLHPEIYAIESCVRTAQPYAANTVIKDVYNAMLNRWERRVFSAVT
jgi:glycosyltransferase involved in cell wall biosynthesis